jgi:hypothetical protein
MKKQVYPYTYDKKKRVFYMPKELEGKFGVDMYCFPCSLKWPCVPLYFHKKTYRCPTCKKKLEKEYRYKEPTKSILQYGIFLQPVYQNIKFI